MKVSHERLKRRDLLAAGFAMFRHDWKRKLVGWALGPDEGRYGLKSR